MSHTRFVLMTTPYRHKQLINELMYKEYEVEGPLFRGYTRPVFNQIIPYDVRMLKEGVPQFLSDLHAYDLAQPIHNNTQHHIPFHRILALLLRLFRKITRHSVPPYTHLTRQELESKGWFYCFVLGEYKDPETTPGVEEL